MVSYDEWIQAVNEAYKAQGGTYQEGTASQLIQLAAEFWQQNKEQLKEMAYRQAVQVAGNALDV